MSVAVRFESWKIETAWGQKLDLPANEIRGVRFRGGRMTYLSDLEPSRVEGGGPLPSPEGAAVPAAMPQNAAAASTCLCGSGLAIVPRNRPEHLK